MISTFKSRDRGTNFVRHSALKAREINKGKRGILAEFGLGGRRGGCKFLNYLAGMERVRIFQDVTFCLFDTVHLPTIYYALAEISSFSWR